MRQKRSEKKSEGRDLLVGRNAIREALTAGRTLNKLWYLESGDQRLRQIVQEVREAGVPVQAVPAEQLARLAPDLTHQGLVAEPAAKDYVEALPYLQSLQEAGQQPLILILDAIQDGHNLGAILRVADAAGIDLVVIGKHRSQALDARVAKASAGAVEFVPVARVTNLSDFVLKIKERGFWVFGLAGEAAHDYRQISYRGSVALIIGNEGRGIAAKLKEHCDDLLSIPMAGRINSLNASVAAALVSFAALEDRQKGAQ